MEGAWFGGMPDHIPRKGTKSRESSFRKRSDFIRNRIEIPGQNIPRKTYSAQIVKPKALYVVAYAIHKTENISFAREPIVLFNQLLTSALIPDANQRVEKSCDDSSSSRDRMDHKSLFKSSVNTILAPNYGFGIVESMKLVEIICQHFIYW